MTKLERIESCNSQQTKHHYNKNYAYKDFKRFPVAEKYFIKSLITRYRIEKNSEILDIGCGTGKYTSLFNQFGMNPLGVDISEMAIEKAQSFYPDSDFRVADVLELDLEKQFDVIFASGFSPFNTNNLDSLYPFMDNIVQFLKKGGLFVFLKTSSLTDSYSKGKTRIDYKTESFREFFHGVKNCNVLETSATYPHTFILFRSLGFSAPITLLSKWNTRLTNIPVRINIVLEKAFN